MSNTTPNPTTVVLDDELTLKVPPGDDPAAVKDIASRVQQWIYELSDDLQELLSLHGGEAPASADHGYALDEQIIYALEDWLSSWPE